MQGHLTNLVGLRFFNASPNLTDATVLNFVALPSYIDACVIPQRHITSIPDSTAYAHKAPEGIDIHAFCSDSFMGSHVPMPLSPKRITAQLKVRDSAPGRDHHHLTFQFHSPLPVTRDPPATHATRGDKGGSKLHFPCGRQGVHI